VNRDHPMAINQFWDYIAAHAHTAWG
jgi:hypothetical protein